MNPNIPFGMTFEETEPKLCTNLLHVIYNNEKQISYLQIDDGSLHPYISYTYAPELETRVRTDHTEVRLLEVKASLISRDTELQTNVRSEETQAI